MGAGFLLDDMKDFNARVFRLLAKEMKVDDLTVPKEEPGELPGGWNRVWECDGAQWIFIRGGRRSLVS